MTGLVRKGVNLFHFLFGLSPFISFWFPFWVFSNLIMFFHYFIYFSLNLFASFLMHLFDHSSIHVFHSYSFVLILLTLFFYSYSLFFYYWSFHLLFFIISQSYSFILILYSFILIFSFLIFQGWPDWQAYIEEHHQLLEQFQAQQIADRLHPPLQVWVRLGHTWLRQEKRSKCSRTNAWERFSASRAGSKKKKTITMNGSVMGTYP